MTCMSSPRMHGRDEYGMWWRRGSSQNAACPPLPLAAFSCCGGACFRLLTRPQASKIASGTCASKLQLMSSLPGKVHAFAAVQHHPTLPCPVPSPSIAFVTLGARMCPTSDPATPCQLPFEADQCDGEAATLVPPGWGCYNMLSLVPLVEPPSFHLLEPIARPSSLIISLFLESMCRLVGGLGIQDVLHHFSRALQTSCRPRFFTHGCFVRLHLRQSACCEAEEAIQTNASRSGLTSEPVCHCQPPALVLFHSQALLHQHHTESSVSTVLWTTALPTYYSGAANLPHQLPPCRAQWFVFFSFFPAGAQPPPPLAPPPGRPWSLVCFASTVCARYLVLGPRRCGDHRFTLWGVLGPRRRLSSHQAPCPLRQPIGASFDTGGAGSWADWQLVARHWLPIGAC